MHRVIKTNLLNKVKDDVSIELGAPSNDDAYEVKVWVINPVTKIMFDKLYIDELDKEGKFKPDIATFRNFLYEKQSHTDVSRPEEFFSVAATNNFEFTCEKNCLDCLMFVFEINSQVIKVLSRSVIDPIINLTLLINNGKSKQTIVRQGNLHLPLTFKKSLKVSELLCATKSTFQITQVVDKHGVHISSCDLFKIFNKLQSAEICVSLDVEWNEKHFNPNDKRRKIDSEALLLNLYNMPDSQKDFIFVASNGSHIYAHTNVVKVQSVYFSGILYDGSATTKKPYTLPLREFTEESVRLFVQCLYGLSLPAFGITSQIGIQLLQLATTYQFDAMCNLISGLLLERGMEFYTVDSILELYHYTRHEFKIRNINNFALSELQKLPTHSIKACEYFKNLPQIQQLTLMNLITKF